MLLADHLNLAKMRRISEEEQEEVGANGDDANGESQSEEDEPEEKVPSVQE